jgi:hypothetical protein
MVSNPATKPTTTARMMNTLFFITHLLVSTLDVKDDSDS